MFMCHFINVLFSTHFNEPQAWKGGERGAEPGELWKWVDTEDLVADLDADWTQTGRRHIRHVAIVAVSVTVIHWELLDFVEATSRGWSLCQHWPMASERWMCYTVCIVCVMLCGGWDSQEIPVSLTANDILHCTWCLMVGTALGLEGTEIHVPCILLP